MSLNRRARLPLLAAGLVVAGCWTPPPIPPPAATPVPVTADGLHNVFKVSDRVYSGSSPDGEAGFAALEKLGVKTVISVDGAAPEVALAGKHGLRYVHLPVGYDGIPQDQAVRIAKAARDLPGPVYVHCHHGKHRGPAAAACAVLAADPAFTPTAADAWLALAGTDPRYRGLVELPRSFRRPTAAELDRAPDDFPPVAATPDLTRLMVAVDARWDHLKAAKAAGWKAPPHHPDADPPHEALQLAELYHEAARLPAAAKKGEDFVARLKAAEAAAGELERALRAKAAPAAAAFAATQAACGACHAKYRD